MEFKVTIDITDKLADAVNALSASIAAAHKTIPQCAQEAPECAKEPEPVIIQAEPESAKIAQPEPQESTPVIDEEQAADCAGVQFHCPTPAQPSPAASTDADAAPEQQEKPEPEKQEPEKPKKKKSAKKVAETPAPVKAPQPESKPEPPAVEAPAYPEPAKTDAPKAADGDPMGGMTVMEAVQALFDAIQQKGLEMADVNARVRAKANELGLSYSSIACLIKAIGYVEARRIALGE